MMANRKTCCNGQGKPRSLDALFATFGTEIQKIQGSTSCTKITILSQEIMSTMKNIISKHQHAEATADTLEKILKTLFDIETANCIEETEFNKLDASLRALQVLSLNAQDGSKA